MSVLGDNKILGSTVNPWDSSASMGGSTAGATAVALGAIPAVHGGDSGGSLRVPASWGGLYTLKPTSGVVSASPGGTELLGLNEIFFVTRSLRDIRLLLGAVSARAADDFSVPAAERLLAPARQLRIGYCQSFYAHEAVDEYILQILDRFIAATSRLGLQPEPCDLRLDFAEACELLYVIGSLDLQTMVRSLSSQPARDLDICQPYIQRWFHESADLRAADVLAATDSVYRMGRQVRTALARFDFVITPVTGRLPPKRDTVHGIALTEGSRALNEEFERLVHFCAAVNIAGLPALVLPFAEPSDIGPCGVQIIGKPGDEVGLLDFAALFDRGFLPPPDSLASS